MSIFSTKYKTAQKDSLSGSGLYMLGHRQRAKPQDQGDSRCYSVVLTSPFVSII
jgi:hypothetical protein